MSYDIDKWLDKLKYSWNNYKDIISIENEQ